MRITIAASIALVLALASGSAAAGDKPKGDPCTADGECATAHCVDGFCCSSACDAPCTICNDPAGPGTCTIAKTPSPSRPCGALPAGLDPACAVMGCTGTMTGGCVPLATAEGTECRAATCGANGLFAAAAKCTSGTCPTTSASTCANGFTCTDTGCLTSCATNADCVGGYLCKAGNCVAGKFDCTDDGQGSVDEGHVVTACAPYTCGDDGRCRETCKTSSECAPGSTCDVASSKCIASIGAGDDGGGCGVAAAADGGHLSASVLLPLIVAGGFALRGRLGRGRRARPPSGA